MRISIGNFIGVDRSVPVTFTDGTFQHKRKVRAAVDGDGNYDRAATKDRVAEVALGVEAKRAAGAFDAAPVVEE